MGVEHGAGASGGKPTVVFWRGERLESGQGTDLKRPNQPGTQGYRAKREESRGAVLLG